MSTKRCLFRKKAHIPEFFISPCFEISPNVQLKKVPTTGEEYLLTVIKERKDCIEVITCSKDYSQFAKNQSSVITEIPVAQGPDKLKPTIQWQNVQVADFSDIRMYVSRLKTKNPIKKKRRLGFDENSIDDWKKFFEAEPTLTCVLRLHGVVLNRGLEALVEIISEVAPGNTISHKTGQWIYAFLACLWHPVPADSMSILREIARQCAEIRSHINEDDENAISSVAPLNMFICLISRYFLQYDLAD